MYLLTKILTRVQSFSDLFLIGLYFARSKRIAFAMPSESVACNHFRLPFVFTPTHEAVTWFDAAFVERVTKDHLALSSLVILDELTLGNEDACLVVSPLGESALRD